MTDVEAKNVKAPTKRKNSNVGNKISPAKKAKSDAGTPKAISPKQANKTKQGKAQNINKKNRKSSESENDSPKKVKAFTGTQSLTEKTKKIQKRDESTGGEKKKRRNQFYSLQLKLKSDDKEKEEAIKKIESKIKIMEGRADLTKTARRKLKTLIKMKKIAEGQPLGQAPQQKAPNSKSDSTKRRERKKNAKQLAKEATLVKKDSNAIQQSNEVKTNGKAKQNKKQAKKQVPQEQVEDSDEDLDVENTSDDEIDNEEESGAEESGSEVEEESDVEEESGGEEIDVEGEESDEEGEEEDDSDEEDTPPPPKIIKSSVNSKGGVKEKTNIGLDELKKTNLVAKNQKRFVLFVGNIPYDTTKQDLIGHFKESGEIKHIRIPMEKESSKPRGFAYVELANEESYQKCLSKHHTFIKGRRINVLYTQGGKKKGDDKKKEIKAKNFKLHAMRRQGQLAGSKKQSQKRSFRRAKQKVSKTENED